MLLLTTTAQLRAYRNDLDGQNIGFFPTMGALHPGHLRSIDKARRENDIVIVSIFVNPLQFSPAEDLQRYPQDLEHDRQLCEKAGVDAIFAPTVAQMLGENGIATTVVPPESMTSRLCGRSRTGHFQGVATIVTKLLNLVQPDRAYFGIKDAQQLAIIRRLVTDLSIPVEIVACATIRETSGLAYSSRNQYLSSQEKESAASLYRSLRSARTAFRQGVRGSIELVDRVREELATVSDIQLEYVELVHPETLEPLETVETVGLLAIAACIGSTRLIDNLQLRQPIVAIDGPAGAGKSTVTRQVARQLKLLYLDTGAMYRAVTWWVLDSGMAVDDATVAYALDRCQLELQPDEEQGCRVWVNDREITREIRTPEVTARVSAVSALPSVRQFLVAQQQRYGRRGGLVAEGRDIGTCVFPDADVKIFLTASVAERAKRRQKDLEQQGHGSIDLQELEESIAERDRQDSTRAISPLRKAEDAIEVQTDNLKIEEVIDLIVSYCR
ncbi:MAG: bifunctional pantoate--beta-alanine ligase/(d)CMP kinase [Geitlerinemataceae cyanobacterium]